MVLSFVILIKYFYVENKIYLVSTKSSISSKGLFSSRDDFKIFFSAAELVPSAPILVVSAPEVVLSADADFTNCLTISRHGNWSGSERSELPISCTSFGSDPTRSVSDGRLQDVGSGIGANFGRFGSSNWCVGEGRVSRLDMRRVVGEGLCKGLEGGREKMTWGRSRRRRASSSLRDLVNQVMDL